MTRVSAPVTMLVLARLELCASIVLGVAGCQRQEVAPPPPFELAPAVAPAPVAVSPPVPSPPRSPLGERVRAGVATVACSGSTGMGFFVTSDTLLTGAQQLCHDGETAQVFLPDGRDLLGTLSSRDPVLDLTRLRVLGAAATPLPVGDSTLLATGMPVTVPSIRGRTLVVLGDAHLQQAPAARRGLSFVQTDMPMSPELAGAPLLNGAGEVVGMVVGSRGAGPGELALGLPAAYWVPPTSTEAQARWQALRAQADATATEDAGSESDAGSAVDAGSAGDAGVAVELGTRERIEARPTEEAQWRARFRAARAKLAAQLKAIDEAPRRKEAIDRQAWRTAGRISPDGAAAYAQLSELVAHPAQQREQAQAEFHQLEVEAARDEVPLEWRR